MTTPDSGGHARPDSLQALHEGTLPSAEEAHVRAHLDRCARCRAELEGWRSLFRELDTLSELSPPEGFGERVLDGLGRRRSLAARITARLRRLLPGAPDPGSHPTAGRLQEHLEGLLSGARERAVEAHLGACRTCAREAAEWRALFGELHALPRLTPPEGFAERVMAGIETARLRERTPAAARSASAAGWKRLAAGLAHAAAGVVPSTRKGWAVLTGIAFTPTVALAALAWAVAAHPLVTLDAVRTFLTWKIAEVGTLTWDGLRESAVGNPLLFRGWELLRDVASTPSVALGTSLAVAVVMIGALWTIYRNLIGFPHTDAPHARPSP